VVLLLLRRLVAAVDLAVLPFRLRSVAVVAADPVVLPFQLRSAAAAELVVLPFQLRSAAAAELVVLLFRLRLAVVVGLVVLLLLLRSAVVVGLVVLLLPRRSVAAGEPRAICWVLVVVATKAQESVELVLVVPETSPIRARVESGLPEFKGPVVRELVPPVMVECKIRQAILLLQSQKSN
jgi:hypothetical protein